MRKDLHRKIVGCEIREEFIKNFEGTFRQFGQVLETGIEISDSLLRIIDEVFGMLNSVLNNREREVADFGFKENLSEFGIGSGNRAQVIKKRRGNVGFFFVSNGIRVT